MTDFVIITENPLFGLDEGDRTGSTQYIWLDYVDSETSFVIFASVYHHVGPLALIQQKLWFTSLGVTAIFIHSLPFLQLIGQLTDKQFHGQVRFVALLVHY